MKSQFAFFRDEKMQRIKSTLKWNSRSETVKTGIIIVLIIGGTLGGYGLFMVAMGTTTPLVVVTSGSMIPTLQVGDLLVLQRVPEDQLKVGNIIVFKDNDTYFHTDNPIVHRIIRIENVSGELRFITKGDANLPEDQGYRTYDEIIGKEIVRIPYIGSVSMFLKTPEGIAVIIILFIVILIVPEFVCKDDDETKEESTDTKSQMNESSEISEPPS
jgi:signal peptidase